jgi:hypothetical protein
MKKQLRDGIKQDVRVVLGELLLNRKEGNTHEYKSLTDSLEKLIYIESNDGIRESSDFNFYKCLKIDIENEINNSRICANGLLKQKDYKNYRHWIESFKRLIQIDEKINLLLNTFKRDQELIRKNILAQLNDKSEDTYMEW